MCRYSSPFPEQFRRLPCVYVCEYTLRFMKSRGELQQHVADFRQNGHRPCPPGEEVYRHGNLSVWEIDGRRHRVYCQNLCLVTTLFLETKTLFYGVDAFLFYVLAEWTDTGATILGCVAVVAVSRPMLAVWCFFSRGSLLFESPPDSSLSPVLQRTGETAAGFVLLIGVWLVYLKRC